MCMKYINVTTRCYKSITTEENNIVSYDIPFTSIRCNDDENGHIYINNFSIVTHINALGTNNDKHKNDNPLEKGRKLDFIIRLTKCSTDESKRIGYDLDSFTIDLGGIQESGKAERACFDFVNYTRTTNVDKLELPGGIGRYVIKVLVKDSEENEYTIQTMFQLTVAA